MPRGVPKIIMLPPRWVAHHGGMESVGVSAGWRDAGRRSVCALGAVMVAAALLGIVRPCPAAAEPTVEVHGNHRVDADAIRNYFLPHREGRGQEGRGQDGRIPEGRRNEAALDRALKDLYATGEFEDVRITHDGDRLIVTVAEAPVVARLQFEGNKALKDKDLAAAVELKPHAPFTRSAVQADVARLVDLYQHSGRYQTQITPKTIAHGDGRVDLVFEIKEGGKTGVKRIVFAGNHAFADSRLKTVIRTTESGWLAWLKTSDVYDPDRIEADAELLRVFYMKNGYADVRVMPQAGVFDDAQQGFTVTFAIDEGARYAFGAVGVESHVAAIDGASLRDALHLDAGSVFNASAVDKASSDLAIELGKRGYPFAAVRPHTSRNVAAGTVDVVFTLDDGPHNYIERIVIRGNTVTHDEVIRREFDIAEGDAYNAALVARAERRLKALSMIKSVKITAAPGSTPDRVVLDVAIEENRTGDINFSGGYSTSAGPIGEISYTETNLMGIGQYLKVAVSVGEYLRSGNLTFVQPYLLDTRMSLGTDFYFKETLTNAYQSYGSENYGATVRLDAPLSDTMTSEARYSLVNQRLTLAPSLMCVPPNATNACASAATQQAVLNGPQWVSSVGTTLAYSTLDNAKNPHEGLRAELREDVAGLGGGVDFMKTTGDVRYYHDLGDDVVGMVRGQGGYVTPYGGQTLPMMNSFYGGPQLVRGFAVNGFGPRDLTPRTTQDNIGGSQYWATTAELQAPIPGLPPEVALKAAGFADAGSLWGYRGQTSFPALSQSLTVGDSRQVRSSVGAGLIWDSPFGPLRVDYAFPITKTPYDVTQPLHFGVGPY